MNLPAQNRPDGLYERFVYVWWVGADLGVVSGSGGSGSPFGEVRLLTAERVGLFTRTAESLAGLFGEELGRWLGDVSVVAGQVEQTTLPDLAGVDGGVDLALVKSLFAVSHGVVASGLELALGVVALLCGGVVSPAPEVRPLSRLEAGVFDLVLAPLVDLASGLFMLDGVELSGHVGSASGLPAGQPEPVVGLPFHVSVGGVEGVVTLGLTGSQLQAYSEELDRRIAGQLAARSDAPSAEVVRAVAPVGVELIVGFELLAVPARQLVGLRVGDVLRTRQSVTRPLVARVGDERLFHVRPAQHGQRLVAELTAAVPRDHSSSTIRNPNGGYDRPPTHAPGIADGDDPGDGVGDGVVGVSLFELGEDGLV